jgi:hypothetical protein
MKTSLLRFNFLLESDILEPECITSTAFARSLSSGLCVLRYPRMKEKFRWRNIGQVCEHREANRYCSTKEPEEHNKLYEP